MKFKSQRLASRTLFLMISVGGLFGIGMTGFVYGWFFCYGCPYAIASCPIGLVEHSFVDMQLQSVLEGLMLLAYVVGFMSVLGALTGRMACGWACPIGFLQDGVDRVRNLVLPKSWLRALEFRDSKFVYVKYAFIVIIPVTSYVFVDTVYTEYCPVGGITGTIPTLIVQPGLWETAGAFVIKMISVTFFFVLAAAFSRGWCRFLCPIGAYLAPFNKFSLFRFKVDDATCAECGVCANVCQMGLEPMKDIQDTECIVCGDCADVCPKDSIRLTTIFSGPGKERGADELITEVDTVEQ